MLTLRDVLAMPAVRVGEPQVLAGGDRLDREVRWVHSTELVDIGPLLRGGDLVLTTGVALPDHPDALGRFAGGLAEADAAGLLVELGRRWTALPPALVETCERLGLPLVALRREVRFVTVAQAVGERLVDAQLAELREAQRVHDTFTELSLDEAGPDEVLAAVQRLSGAAVVLENGQHRVVDYRPGPGDVAAFLDDWERRSRRVQPRERTSWDESNGWLVTRIGRPERSWGRLVIGSPGDPPQRMVAVAERAAAALAMHRLHDRSRDGRLRRLHQELLLGMLANPGDAEVVRRAGLAGLPLDARQYVGLAIRPATEPSTAAGLAALLDDVVAATLHATELARTGALVAAVEDDVRVLLAVPPRADAVAGVDGLVAQVRARVPVVAAVGTPVDGLDAADRTLRESAQVLTAVAGRADAAAGVHRLEDVHVRGLLVLLADDERVRVFARRELAPLRQADARDGTDLLGTLRALLEHPGSRSAAAAALHVSRPVLYDRIARIERVLGASLGDAELRTSLHVAVIAADLAADVNRAGERSP
ncbi:PucR family transcriptional regulator [Nocardioides dongkuii]|uniref:PucR family transcriptional regulator n=1 Tax=Nocardioides dongkuii TaxID=2760089 RepID=UPI0029D40F94|nr:PucR family transcriptional regulator ligand-binding domain-containing protein [Nocardioides dongkuii]